MSRRDYVRSEFDNYNYCKKRIDELKIKIGMIEYKMMNVHSPRLDGVAVHQSSDGKPDGWYNLEHKKELYLTELDRCRNTIAFVDDTLKTLSKRDRAILRDKFIEGYSFKRLSKKYCFRLNYTYKLVDKILDRIANQED